MQIEYIWIALAVILLLLELWAINVVLRSTGGWETKGLWVVVLIFVPLLGLIAWAMFGPKREMAQQRRG
nr:PLDc N-terminal domain-containing protein [uncultured Pseudomonas sp.]